MAECICGYTQLTNKPCSFCTRRSEGKVPASAAELINCFFCKQTYKAEVQYDKETGILLPHLESQLECPNEDCPSHARTIGS